MRNTLVTWAMTSTTIALAPNQWIPRTTPPNAAESVMKWSESYALSVDGT